MAVSQKYQTKASFLTSVAEVKPDNLSVEMSFSEVLTLCASAPVTHKPAGQTKCSVLTKHTLHPVTSLQNDSSRLFCCEEYTTVSIKQANLFASFKTLINNSGT